VQLFTTNCNGIKNNLKNFYQLCLADYLIYIIHKEITKMFHSKGAKGLRYERKDFLKMANFTRFFADIALKKNNE